MSQEQPAEQPEQPADNSDLRPELQPVAKRHGREMLDFAVRVGASNMSIDWLKAYALTHSKVGPHLLVLMDSQAHFCNMVMQAKGWQWDTLIECLQDIDRASKLVQPTGNA